LWKAGLVVLGAIFMLGSLAVAWYSGVVVPGTRDTLGGLILVSIASFLAAGGAIIMWNPDRARKAWFAGIPDVDAEAAKAFEAEIAANPDLGSTPAERLERLATARKVARFAALGNVGLPIWVLVVPRPYELMLLLDPGPQQARDPLASDDTEVVAGTMGPSHRGQ
jgi:hypothetical protein